LTVVEVVDVEEVVDVDDVVAAVVVVVPVDEAALSTVIAFTDVWLGASTEAPLGTKAMVTRRNCENLMDDGSVVIVGFAWEKLFQ
jgi:hypothetical protein